MCGIYGCVGEIDYGKAMECIMRIKHRGPDALMVKKLNGATIAHARLSILDISESANQPMSDITGRYWIVYNGEIYNYIELRKELKELGYKFKTNGDTEVALYAYIAWGESFQYKCNGMWAIAIWDDYEKKLFLSRDRFGVKPLYYYSQTENFHFASEMKAFFPVMKERKPNRKMLYGNPFLSFEASRETVINDIYNLPAGYCGLWENNELKIHRWWNTLENLVQVPDSYDDQVDMLRELFLDSCKIRMRSDVPIGTALSGGIDSSAVIGAMSLVSDECDVKVNTDWRNTFVASFPNADIDETRYAEWAAQYVGLNVNKVEISSDVQPEEIMREIYLCEVPYITSPIPFIQTYRVIREKGIKVTIDGHGSDELFCGYDNGVLLACAEVGFEKEEFEQLSLIYHNMVSVEHNNKMLNKEEIERRALNFSNRADMLFDGITNNLDRVNKQLYFETHSFVLPTLLRCYDRYSMANGLEIRMPFMDYRIVCFAFSIPWRSKIRNGFSKSIVRDMARPFMDARVLNRRDKIGFSAPMDEWLRGNMKEFLLDTINSNDFRECSLINALEVNVEVNEFIRKSEKDFSLGERIWQRIVPYLWEKAVIKS